MNGFRIWTLQDLSYILSTKSLQNKTHLSTKAFQRCFSNFLNSSRKQENARESRRIINLATVSNNLEPIFTTWMALPEITTIFNFRSPTYLLPLKTNIETIHLEALKPVIKLNDELLNGNPTFRSQCYKILSNIQAGDFGFVYNDNTIIRSDKVYYDNCISKITFALAQKNQQESQPEIDRTIKVPTNDLSTCNAKNSLSPVEVELKTLEIQQRQSQDLFETLQQLNTVKKMQRCTENAAKSSFLKKIGREGLEVPRKIPLEWSFMERSYPRREYHTWKLFKIENDAIRCDDHHFFASDIRIIREQNPDYRSSRFDCLIYSESSGNEGSRKSSLCLPFVPRRLFSSRSCTVIQQSLREIKLIKNLRKDLNANTLIVRNTRSYPDRVSLKSFSCGASRSKKFADCEKDHKSQRSKHEDDDTCSQEVARSRCRIESKKNRGKTRRKDARVSSRDEERREGKSESCKSYTCPQLKQQLPCTWVVERCPEVRRKDDAKGRVTSRDRARTRDSCPREQSIDTRCSNVKRQQSKSYKQYEHYEKSDESPAICKDSIKERNCESKYEKQRKKCDIGEKERRKCTGNSRKRSNSCRRRNSSRAGDKSRNKVDGKRRYSQQSIFFVPQDRKSFSTLIPDIVLNANVNKTTQRFYASCSKDEKDRKQSPSYEKPKKICETKEKGKIKKKCVKGPAKCISRKKVINKKTCQSTQKDKHKKASESIEKSNREKFCTNRKEKFMKDKKQPKEQSMKEQQLDREYKEIDECKKEKKNKKVKMVSTEYKPNLDHIISSYKEQKKKNSEKLTSTPNESIISVDTIFKWLIPSRITNSEIPIVTKDVKLFNVMFDRLFYTAKLNYQNDSAIEQTMKDDKTAQNYSANNDDFIYGDELPNYVEIEYEDEKDDVYD